VNPYTVTKPAQTARLRRLGVDGVIADSASVLDS
jgi:glycerophosphoryl diester phosphodiesterase